MKDTEKYISPLIESQFPSFYKEEGPQFIAFVKAYYQWMEQANNVLYHTRRLPQYKDIDTSVDDFLVHFKEKYLRNIQFNTATDKRLLVKNSIDLYRSKGTERSINLFFRLVYGTGAQVRYPADYMLRPSDGIWVKPQYLEITYSKYSVNYVNKQIVGSLSGATAFVERYIRRRVGRGYVNVLYISNLTGNFINNETIGVTVSNAPQFDQTKNSFVVGSISEADIISGSKLFSVGDLVNFTGSDRGEGGVARVSAVTNSSGIVDISLVDGGFGYTTDSEGIVSEKVITLSNVQGDTNSQQFFKLFENLVEPQINISVTSVSSNLSIGDNVYRYATNGAIVSQGRILSLSVTSNTGTIKVSHTGGVFTNTANYYTYGNAISFYANTVENRTVAGKVMGIPTTISLSVANVSGSFSAGDFVYQNTTSAVLGTATVNSAIATIQGYDLVLSNLQGIFKNSAGNIKVQGSSSQANISSIGIYCGVYDIKKHVFSLSYDTANNSEIVASSRIYQYNSSGNVQSEGILLTVNHDGGTNTGNLTYIPIRGYFADSLKAYTNSNTSVITVTGSSSNQQGDDFLASQYGRIITSITNTIAVPSDLSVGTGASFSIGALTDTETIFINTDLLVSNNEATIDTRRKQINVTSETGFASGDYVYQRINQIKFSSNSTTVNAQSGFIVIPNANQIFTVGQNIKYDIDTGNTAIYGLGANEYYRVAVANSTGLILRTIYSNSYINNTNYTGFANNLLDESGHNFYELSIGTVFSTGSGVLNCKDIVGTFGLTGSTPNSSVSANSNIIKYTSFTTNTAVSSVAGYVGVTTQEQPFYILPIRNSVYGFLKNPLGNFKTQIFSCLNYGSYNIGTISSLASVNPGSGYNISPYFLPYQPIIAERDRRDYVISITNTTKLYTQGEEVTQTQGNLVIYDVKVSSDVYSNNYSAIVEGFNSAIDVDSGNNIIYVPNLTYTFNSNTGVQSGNDFITITNNQLASNNLIRYYTDTGNTVVSGLSNNTLYYVSYSNTTGIALALTQGGSNIGINATSTSETGHNIRQYTNRYSSNTRVVYSVPGSNTAVQGLQDNTAYYIIQSTDFGFKLATEQGNTSTIVDITANSTGGEEHYISTLSGYLPNEKIYQNVLTQFNSNTQVNSTSDRITITNQPYSDGDSVLYYTSVGNTVVSGLANNTTYYVVNSNATYIKLANTVGGSAIDLTASSTSETGHNLLSVANGYIKGVYTLGSNGYVQVRGVENTIANGYIVYSYTNPFANGLAQNVSLSQETITAKGIVKANSTLQTLYVKRISFENSFKEGSLILGTQSGAEATITSVQEDSSVRYPIGLNGLIQGEVTTANGQVTDLQIIDSGLGYLDTETVNFQSQDKSRTGSVKLTVSGAGIGQGYYKSNKGFLSDDIYVQDSDYYQEYSYEVFSSISIDKYSDMFKKVMHMAGTKFFGSALIEDEESVSLEYANLAVLQEVSFNAQTDVNSTNETITINCSPIPFSNGDVVKYTVDTGNTAVSGLTSGNSYYVVNTSTSTVKLSLTSNGSPINITSSGTSEVGHYLTKTFEE